MISLVGKVKGGGGRGGEKGVQSINIIFMSPRFVSNDFRKTRRYVVRICYENQICFQESKNVFQQIQKHFSSTTMSLYAKIVDFFSACFQHEKHYLLD